MTPKDVAERVKRISELAIDDYESAHAEEDKLYADVLRAIAHEICDEPGECARVALCSGSIQFIRVCA